jgi:hypothetical protein
MFKFQKLQKFGIQTIGAVSLDVDANLVMAAPAFTATESAVDVATKVTLTFLGVHSPNQTH